MEYGYGGYRNIYWLDESSNVGIEYNWFTLTSYIKSVLYYYSIN